MLKIDILFDFKLFVVAAITMLVPQSIFSKMLPRHVTFINDLSDMVELDLLAQKPFQGHIQEPALDEHELECLRHFQQIPITIRAEKEYKIRDGDRIPVETKRKWEILIEEISNQALLSLKTFRDLVLEHFLPKKSIGNFMDKYIWSPYHRAKLFIYQKLIARFATTTIIIHTDIEPYHETRKCSDIILDLDQLAAENKLTVEIEHENLLSMQVIIKPKYGSLPHVFF